MEGVKNRAVGPIVPPSVVVYPKPLGRDRVEHYESFAPGETLGAYVKRVGLSVPSRVVRVEHNGREVPLALWQRLIPRHGDMVVIAARGLGGGGGGNKILRTVAMVALVVAAVTIPGAGIAGLYSGFGLTGTLGGALLSAGIMLGGSLLINALLPPPTPTAAKLGTGQKYTSSPTYSIQGGRNRARQWEPMSLVFGRHKVVPDYGSKPYVEQAGDDQYLCQSFHFGLQGAALLLTDLKIGETAIENYQAVQTQRAMEDGKLSMVRGNVDTIQGFTLKQADGWIQRTTSPDTTSIVVDLSARLFRVNDDGSMSSRSVVVRIQYREVGQEDWIEQGTIDAVIATHYWALLDRTTGRQVRYGSTNRADHYDGQEEIYDYELWFSSGFAGIGYWQWRTHPYQLNQPWAGVAPNPVVSPTTKGTRISGARQEPTRRSVAWEVPAGQYDVRVMKVTADVSDSRESNETAVGQILAVQTDDADYTGQARLAMRIKATGQLNGAVDEFNAIASAMCPVWDGGEWVTKETSNPAWWYLWFARGKLNDKGSRVYGAGMADTQIEIDAIKAWALWCDAKKLAFNYVLDAKTSTADVLRIIARAGRATPTFQTGRLGVIWDAENLPETAVFGPFNVKAGSFKIAYVNEGTVDEVVVNFVNEETWAMDEVRAKVPGALATNNPLQLDLDGVTSKDQAGREANLIAAAQTWKRRRITWETDVEGMISTRGDVVRFSHDLAEWGFAGRMMPGSGGVTIKLQNKVPSGGTGIALLRDPDGNMKTVSVVSAVGDVDELTITTGLDGFPMPGDEGFEDCSPFDWTWQFDPIATPGRRFKITGVKPAGDGLRFEAMDDDPEYYACENNPYQYTPPRDGALLAGVVLALTGTEQIISVSTDQIRFSLSWLLSSDTQSLVSIMVNGLPRVSEVTASRMMDLMVATGDVVDVTITPRRGTGSGEPRRQTFVIQGLAAPLPPVTGLTSVFRDGLTVLSWLRVVDVREPWYEIRLGPTWANAQVVAQTPALETLAVGNGLYHVAAAYRLADGTTVYGPADTLQIAGAVLVRNVILTRDEAPEWEGAVSEGAMLYHGKLTLAALGDVLAVPDVLAEPDMLWLGGAAPRGVYTIAEADRIDIGFTAAVRIGFDVDLDVVNSNDDLLSVADILSVADVLNGSRLSHAKAMLQVRSANVEGDWTDWRDYVPGLINARYFDIRLVLQTDDPSYIPFVNEFTWFVDVPDLIQRGEGLSVGAGGLRVAYAKAFHGIPNVQITILDAQDADRAVLTDSDETGFTIAIMNGATPVAREINWLAQGY